ncbi:MAG: tRNA (adenosine(37)-N6)-dimethylallyltransferase MiaA, partial [Actinobacteria bacterium]|nr:tRNA (adenosine(37)-N6)-dimethylallyltransferase MiaA [Actinomycetota bacterium]NIS37315.1 tRNA (adenosine(37)-N6)-dimethylallyltransferase MiaA [Actinomycetota bacterium]NIT99214.1 tRNA (adenosine(37)-N6)-dimethylallyltransferase MiaA [Actinomycetota bacterium]NIU22814.1 tRNA (adenosine(37)-N6)-dimethylallyltransferase MiaA [Actinomycetota bacterium]NIU71756.1 tRNA (adenosine(37)-N6)-dimethylallyltransferase MiaA [Actinomycetota bacterium]
AEVPHHLIDLVEPEEIVTVADIQALGRQILSRLAETETAALIVGGSGLHFRSIVDPLEFPPSDPSTRLRFEELAGPEAVAALLEADAGAGEV